MKKMKWILGVLLMAALVLTAVVALGDTAGGQPVKVDDWKYDGNSYPLVEAPATGTFYYRYTYLDTQSGWDTHVPEGQDAGLYSVYFIASDTQPSDTEQGVSLGNVTVSQRELTLVWAQTDTSGTNYVYTYDGEEHGAEVTGVTCDISGDVPTADDINVENGKKTNASSNAYTATASLPAEFATNFTITNPNQSYTINRHEITLGDWTLDTKSETVAVYTGSAHPVAVTVNHTAQGTSDTCTITLKEGENEITGITTVGSHTITAVADDNHSISGTATKAFTISQKPINLSWTVGGQTGTSLEYCGSDYSVVASSADIISGETVTITPTTSSAKEAGDYNNITASLSGNDAGNYSIVDSTNTFSFSITKKPVGLTWTNGTPYTYSGEQQNPTAVCTDVLPGDTCKPVYDTVTSINQGSYTYKVTGVDNSNYELASSAVTEAPYVIDPSEVGLSWSNLNDLTYNGTAQYPTATATGLKGSDTSDTCRVTVTKPDSAQDPIHQGNYTAVASALSNPNYKLPAATACIASYTINKLTATLNWKDTIFTYDGDPHQPTATVSNLQTIGTTQDVCNVTLSDSSTQTAANVAGQTYGAEAISLSNTDYQLPDNPTTRFTINPESLTDTDRITVTGLEDSYPYTSNPIEPDKIVPDDPINVVDSATGKLVKGTDYTVAYSGNHTNVSDSDVTITITGQGNYKDSIANNKFTITPLALELTWTMDEDSAKRECVYNGAAHPIGVSSAQILPADKEKVTLSLDKESVTDVGEYVITATKNGDDETQNYTMPSEPKETFKVTPKPISENWVYHADQIYNGYPIETVTITDPDLGYQLVKDTDYSIVYSDDHTNVGEVTATITCLDGSNYTGNAEVKFNIDPKSIADPSIKIADLADEVYTTKEIKPTLKVTDTDREDTELVLDQDYTVTYAQNVKQGTAIVTITGKNNYKEENGTTFVITRKPVKPITVTVNGPTEDTKRLGGPDASKYHTITIDAEADKTFGKMTVTITKEGAAVTTIKDVYAGDITIEKDAINGAVLDGSGDVTYTVTGLYDDADNLTTDAESTRESKPAPEASDKFNYDTTAKPITVKPLYNRAAKGVGVTLPEGYRLVKFTSTGAGTDFVATNAASLTASDHIIPFNVGENPKLNSTAKGGSFTGEYEDYVGNKGTVATQEILKARGTIEIVSVEPPINDSGRIGYTPSLTFTVKMSADGGFAELASGGVFGSRTLTQGEQLITVSSSSLAADTTNTPSLAFEDLEGSATFRSFIYDPVCDQPVLTIEPYAGAYYLMGLAEPYSSIVMEVNGEKVTGSADAFGVFALKLPLTEEGDMISLKVTDLAGNIALASYRVGPESEDVNSTAFMAGRVLTNAHSPNVTKLGWTMVLTANVDDLKAGKVNVPILAANMVSVGTMSVKMDANDNLSYSYVLDDGVQVLSEKFIANTKLDKEAFIAQIGIEVSPSGTLITDIQKGRVYLSCKMSVSVPADKLKTTFQTEKIKDSEMKKLYRDIQNGKLN